MADLTPSGDFGLSESVTTEQHQTEVLRMGDALNPIHQATCACGWESANLHTRRRGAVDDARAHRLSANESDAANE
jgi:hypothetical protein